MNPIQAPPPPREPGRELTKEELAALLRRLRAPLDAMAPTPLMIVLLGVSLALFLFTVCFVAWNDYERHHPEIEVRP